MNILRRISNHLFIYPYYRRHFKKFGRKSNLLKPLKIDFPQNISIEDNVLIQEYAWLAAVPLTGATTCHLRIGEGSVLGHFNHIYGECFPPVYQMPHLSSVSEMILAFSL